MWLLRAISERYYTIYVAPNESTDVLALGISSSNASASATRLGFIVSSRG